MLQHVTLCVEERGNRLCQMTEGSDTFISVWQKIYSHY